MSNQPVLVRELAAWGFDAFAARGAGVMKRPLEGRAAYEQTDPRCQEHPLLGNAVLQSQRERPDLQQEMEGLSWDLAVIDLRLLLAFQRRLSFDAQAPPLPIAASGESAELLRVTFGLPKPVQYTTVLCNSRTLELQSADPNFALRLSNASPHPVIPTTGSPFLEVAEYRGRWFLRDGYHRAYHLLRAGLFVVPAVVVRAKTLAELGADQPWFFTEAVLFSQDPPRVVDFLDDAVTMTYTRSRLLKTLRLNVTTDYLTEGQPGDEA